MDLHDDVVDLHYSRTLNQNVRELGPDVDTGGGGWAVWVTHLDPPRGDAGLARLVLRCCTELAVPKSKVTFS